jgi:hypothetical protein
MTHLSAQADTFGSATNTFDINFVNIGNAGILASSTRSSGNPTFETTSIGFRVASVPEPSTYALLLLGAGAAYLWKRRKSSL